MFPLAVWLFGNECSENADAHKLFFLQDYLLFDSYFYPPFPLTTICIVKNYLFLKKMMFLHK